jgi:hypothetical protein
LSSRLLSRKVKVQIYKTIILLVVLYGCETWSLKLREEHRLRVSENRVLRRIFGPKRDEVTGEWRKLHSEELHNLYSFPDIIRQVKANEVGGACSSHGKGEKSVEGFWWESPKERDHLEDQGVGGEMGSEWILERLAWGCGLDSTVSGQGPVAGCSECSDEPSGSYATELVKTEMSWSSNKNSCFLLRRPRVEISVRRPTTHTESFRDFPQFFKQMLG